MLFFALAAASIAVIGAVIFIAFSRNQKPAAPETVSGRPVACLVHGIQHRVEIAGGQVLPAHTDAVLCDTLTITNEDHSYRIIAFGPHEHHVTYDGVTEKILGFGQSLTVALNVPGTYTFHDHLEDTVSGSFTVR